VRSIHATVAADLQAPGALGPGSRASGGPAGRLQRRQRLVLPHGISGRLDNGQVFFGKLADAGSPFLTLREVYYVQTVVEKDQKKANVLIKRGSEWHNPDYMRINAKHVVVIEPVAPDSRVAQLIREARQHPAGAAPPAKAATPPPAAPPPGAEKPKKGPRP